MTYILVNTACVINTICVISLLLVGTDHTIASSVCIALILLNNLYTAYGNKRCSCVNPGTSK